MVNTKTAPRRELSFGSLDELSAELDRIDAAHAAGNLGHTGNWTPAQILDHVGIFWTHALDGFPPGKPPLPMRMLVQLFFKKSAVQGKQPPTGIKLPAKASYLMPSDDPKFAPAMEKLRTCIERVKRGDSYVPASPLFGKLARDEWTRMNLGHCAMHLSFISINE